MPPPECHLRPSSPEFLKVGPIVLLFTFYVNIILNIQNNCKKKSKLLPLEFNIIPEVLVREAGQEKKKDIHIRKQKMYLYLQIT